MPDRRVLRTQNMVLDAFLDLMIEKGYAAITVQDIIDRANIGRSTFYLHFTDKENLLECSVGQLREFINEQIKNRIPSGAAGKYHFGFSLAMLQHAQSHKRLYKVIVGKAGESPVMHRMQQMLAQLVREEITALMPPLFKSISEDVFVDFTVNSFFTVLSWWMDRNMPCPAREADELFHSLALGGLGAFQ